MVHAPVLGTVTNGYLAMNQLNRLLGSCSKHLEATVLTCMSSETRPFSWIWEERKRRALLVNRVTGTLFCPTSGKALAGSPVLVGAPFEIPPITPADDLPSGMFWAQL